MDAYVEVGNDLQLAVTKIMLSKRAFLKQSRCIKELQRQNTLLQEKVNELEMHNKELRALSLLTKQNQSLKKEMSELESKLHTNREHVLNEILALDTFLPSEVTTSTEDTTTSSDINSTGDEHEEDVVDCPLSPTKRKRIHNKEFTPQKKTQQRNKSQPGSGSAVEGKTTVFSRRRSCRVKKKNTKEKNNDK